MDIGNTSFTLSEREQNRLAVMYGGVDLIAENVAWTEVLAVWECGVNQRLDVSNTYPVNDPAFQRGESASAKNG